MRAASRIRRVYGASWIALQLLAGAAVAQCGQWDSIFGTPAGSVGAPQAAVLWDPDGSGPLPKQLVIGGSISSINGVAIGGVARWDGVTWQPVGGALGTINALAVWDPDGAGPLAALLVAGGTFSGGSGASPLISYFDGTSWRNLGSGLGPVGSTAVLALTIWDPDGSGPLSPQIIAGGTFTNNNGPVSLNRLARWDGAAWQPFGTGADAEVRALGTWDPDGAGPQPPRLIAGGTFSNIAGTNLTRIGQYNGTSWQNFNVGLDSAVNALGTWDPDGAGPAPEFLLAGGYFNHGLPATIYKIAKWDGFGWSPLGSGLDTVGHVYSISTWDPDGDGLSRVLVAGHFNTTANGQVTLNHASNGDGTTWSPMETGLSSISSVEVYATLSWDPDAEGPAAPEAVFAGRFQTAGGKRAPGIARWNGQTWRPFGTGVNNQVKALATWDPDGSGPARQELLVGGWFTDANGVRLGGIGHFDGTAIQSFGTGLDGLVNNVISWNTGTLPPRVVVAGTFPNANGGVGDNIFLWDGVTWSAIGTGSPASAVGLATWDPDGEGPLPEQLFAGGDFPAPVGGGAYLGQWTGSSWQSVGGGVDGSVSALLVWDPDGTGPLPSELVVGGNLTTAGGIPVNRIAGWNGTSWHAFGSGMNFGVLALCNWRGSLIAAGGFTTAGGSPASCIARWDGSQWQPLGLGLNSAVYGVASWDPDGAGPLPEELVAAGIFSASGTTPVSRIARWNGTDWQPCGSGLSGTQLGGGSTTCYAVTSWADGSPATLGPRLVVAGNFTTAGGQAASGVSSWVFVDPPFISVQPSSTSACLGGGAALSLIQNGIVTMQWEWREKGSTAFQAVTAGTNSGASGPRFWAIGPQAAALQLSSVTAGPGLEMRCQLVNQCGSVTSDIATVAIACTCYANCDNSTSAPILNANDFQCFLNSFASGSPYANCDRSLNPPVLNANDFQCFLNAFAVGCP